MGAWSTAKVHVPDLFKRVVASRAALDEIKSGKIVYLANFRMARKNYRFLLRECDRFCTHKDGGRAS
jgi:hypothetical protein